MLLTDAVLDKQPAAPAQARADLLLLVHRIPYPPNKGDKIRSYNLLKHLAQRYRVHLATFIDDPDDWQHVPAVEAMCASSHFVRLGPLQGRLRGLGSLAAGGSISQGFYRDAGMQAWVDRTVREHGVGRIVVFCSPMAQYADSHAAARRVIDFCDVDSDKWRQYADKKSWPRRRSCSASSLPKARTASDSSTTASIPSTSARTVPIRILTRRRARAARPWYSLAPWTTGPTSTRASGSPRRWPALDWSSPFLRRCACAPTSFPLRSVST